MFTETTLVMGHARKSPLATIKFQISKFGHHHPPYYFGRMNYIAQEFFPGYDHYLFLKPLNGVL
jgi:hypothetical protein